MASRFRISCDQCSFVAHINVDAEHYVLPDGSHAHASLSKAWCAGCKGVSLVEYVPTEEELHANHLKLATRREDANDPLFATLRKAKADIDEAVRRLEHGYRASLVWRALRTKPAHCIRCGSTSFVRLVMDDNYFCRSTTTTFAGRSPS
jgi:hypothetical protein